MALQTLVEADKVCLGQSGKARSPREGSDSKVDQGSSVDGADDQPERGVGQDQDDEEPAEEEVRRGGGGAW